MKTFLGVGVFVEMRAVKSRQAVRVAGKVRGHPIQNNAQAGGMGRVHKILKILRAAKARRRREHAQRLVAPGRVQRMLTDRHQLQMRKAQVAGIRHQRIGQFAVVQPAPAIRLAPGAQVHFVHRQGRIQRVGCGTRRLHRAPGWQPTHYAGRGRPQLGLESIGVCLEHDAIVRTQNFKLVGVAAHYLG